MIWTLGVPNGARSHITPPPEALLQLAAFIQLIHDAGPKTQNYDKGFHRFIRKFDPDIEVQGTMAIVKGYHDDHWSAVCLMQKKRRCLLLDTTFGLTDDEACGRH
jgi:hypothetical protein